MLNPRRRSLWWMRGMYWLWLSSVVVVRWRCRPLASSVGIVMGVGVVHGCWHRLLALSVGVGVICWHRHWRWRRPLALALSVGIGVVHWHWCCPLASLALSVGVVVVVVHWLVDGCERMWALVTVVGASGMGVVWCRLLSMVVLVGVGRVACGCCGCGCG